jgi:UDP-N-acetylmuramyl pentapeptide phosphotransferase/UDP-N-acetylglucosamine-1-phosphate transferase
VIGVGAFLAGALSTAALWRGLRGPFTRTEALQRANYRGHRLPVAAGLAVVLGTVVVQAMYALVERIGGIDAAEAARGATVVGGATIGFALIGLFDDLAGDTTVKGFAGHLGALRHGEVTSGLVKLAGGVLFGVLAVPGDLVASLRGGLLVAAAANLANLFDRAPGRVVKVSLLGGVVVVALGGLGWPLTGPLVVLGGGAAMLWPDLREQCMLGDTGANVLGAAVGWGLVLALGSAGEWVALAVMVLLNLASERVSFTRVIDAVAPLRWFDRLGALPERRLR